jgi:Putative peptidoglycan binding domain
MVVAAIAGALVGGAVAGGVAVASANDGGSSSASGSTGSGSVSTAAVVRTNLQSTVQVGGSIGYPGSYAVNAPMGASPQQVSQAQQAVTQAEQGLANDETSDSFTTTGDDQAITAAQDALETAAANLGADRTAESSACAGRGASTPACTQDTQKVSQDQSQYNQAKQQLDSANLNAERDRDQNQAKLQSDTDQLQAAQANLASVQATAVNPGTAYTSLPKAGDIIGQNQAVYSVNGRPVPLLYGALPAYRAFYEGMTAGEDVAELTHDLIALGYGAGLTQSDNYSAATAAAVKRWQTALGLPATGTVLLGEVVFEPGPIRVTSVTPSVGQAVSGGNILDATGTTPVVTIDLDVTQEYLLKPGDPVTVELPDGVTTVGGVVQSVGNVAVCPGGGNTGNGNPSGDNTADQTPCTSSGSGSSSTPTVTVTVTLDSTPPGATLDQAPVNVNITTQRADNVLAAPVDALLALQGGGFGVDVVSGNTSRLVGVTTGLYSNTLVQISGTGITAGTLVEVPSSS